MFWKSDRLQKFSKADGLVVEICAGTCATAKDCMLLEKHRTFVRCDVNPEVLSAAEADSVLMFASQGLNHKLDMSGSSEVQAAAKVSAHETGAFLAKKNTAV